ncbi:MULTISPECIES: SDR family oxidoreductase [Paenibacillus]|uniref:Sugar epimerase n=1 Tax=Paenibacillus campinasensis TaxID=66347 RepID=A0A268EUW7_9BACL|nr:MULTISPECIES: SDR family oxidoreductase [Paenibacillus]PAD76910.1 sugar epimerase [Paenibacillus campinasensis]PAK55945.1 sugar epimerase [Paenibacillus sp. 7541]
MNVLIIGANGQIGQHLVRQMQQSAELNPIAMVRKEEQKAKYEQQGVQTALVDLEGSIDHIASAAQGADAIVFTAGSGGHTGADKTMLIDLDGAIKSMEAAKQAGIQRFVMVSAIGVHHREKWMASAPHYSAAKYYADMWLMRSGLDYTIIRPGGLTNEPGTGKVKAAADVERGNIPREDVASTILAALADPSTMGKAFDLISGDTPIEQALKLV